MKVFRKVLFTLALAGNITILSSQNVAVFDEFLYKSESQMKASENQYLNPILPGCYRILVFAGWAKIIIWLILVSVIIREYLFGIVRI